MSYEDDDFPQTGIIVPEDAVGLDSMDILVYLPRCLQKRNTGERTRLTYSRLMLSLTISSAISFTISFSKLIGKRK
jgi:hypothetical protein